MSDSLHIADAESQFRIVNVTPDFCVVEGQTIPFDIFKDLTPERMGYAKKVNARGVPVLTIQSVVKGVVGNMGEGFMSGVSQEAGDSVVLRGVRNVRAEGSPVGRHLDVCLMNVKVD